MLLWLFLGCALLSLLGVHCLRRDKQYGVPGPVATLEWFREFRRARTRPFSSSTEALLWCEWKRHGWKLPVISFFICVFLYLFSYGFLDPMRHSLILISVTHSFYGAFFFAIVLASPIVGWLNPFRSPIRRKGASQFYRMHPVSNSDLALSRLLTAFKSFARGNRYWHSDFPDPDGAVSPLRIGKILSSTCGGGNQLPRAAHDLPAPRFSCCSCWPGCCTSERLPSTFFPSSPFLLLLAVPTGDFGEKVFWDLLFASSTTTELIVSGCISILFLSIFVISAVQVYRRNLIPLPLFATLLLGWALLSVLVLVASTQRDPFLLCPGHSHPRATLPALFHHPHS